MQRDDWSNPGFGSLGAAPLGGPGSPPVPQPRPNIGARLAGLGAIIRDYQDKKKRELGAKPSGAAGSKLDGTGSRIGPAKPPSAAASPSPDASRASAPPTNFTADDIDALTMHIPDDPNVRPHSSANPSSSYVPFSQSKNLADWWSQPSPQPQPAPQPPGPQALFGGAPGGPMPPPPPPAMPQPMPPPQFGSAPGGPMPPPAMPMGGPQALFPPGAPGGPMMGASPGGPMPFNPPVMQTELPPPGMSPGGPGFAGAPGSPMMAGAPGGPVNPNIDPRMMMQALGGLY